MITKINFLEHSIYDKKRLMKNIEKEVKILKEKYENYALEIRELQKRIKKEVKNGAESTNKRRVNR